MSARGLNRWFSTPFRGLGVANEAYRRGDMRDAGSGQVEGGAAVIDGELAPTRAADRALIGTKARRAHRKAL